jgi:ApaG protein
MGDTLERPGIKKFKADEELGAQMVACPSVLIAVETSSLLEQTNPSRNLFAHQYTVTIENRSDETIKLLNRHWKIYCGSRQISDIKGEGVVGEQPVLLPREEYTYTSWTVIPQAVGCMSGSYTFRGERSCIFDVEIPRFELIFVDERVPQ